VGESGSGKTTIGRAIVRINPCSAGAIYYDGKKISGKLSRKEDREGIRKIQMVFQDPAASLNERATIEYIISEGLYNFHLYKDEKDRIAKIEKVVRDVGLLPEHLTAIRTSSRRTASARRPCPQHRHGTVFIIATSRSPRWTCHPRAGPEPHEEVPERARPDLSLHRPRPVHRALCLRPHVVIYKGRIMEIARRGALRLPAAPYTKSLISAIPFPIRSSRRARSSSSTTPRCTTTARKSRPSRTSANGHMVFGSAPEIEKFRAIASPQRRNR
jgi:oligopeptide transport system ATP-binding protein